MNIRYPLYNLDDKEFENLVTLICENILGTGTIVFSDGKDGGRDALFTGRANSFPSEASPWEGQFIIQSKHTTKPVASCSDSEFNTIVKKEIPKIQKLKESGKLDYYLLFTNRKLSGIKNDKIDDLISENIAIENRLIGDKRIQLWLQKYPSIVKTLGLNKLLMPLEFYEKDLQKVVVAFSKANIPKEALKALQNDLTRIPIKEKNKLNKLGEEYFENVLKASYSEFNKITSYLNDPKNNEYKIMYDNTICDLQAKIILKRNDFYAFEEIIEFLCDYILDINDTKLLNNRRLIRVFIHYMYFYCDIGKKETGNAET